MITTPAGWTQHFGVHLVSLYPPDGGGRIRYHERLGALRPFSAVIATVLANDPAFVAGGPPRDVQTVITSEGEYGAWARIDGARAGRAAVHFVAAIFGDEFVAAVDALVLEPARGALIEQVARELVVGATLRLGTRRRRFLYTPPPGWQAVPSGLTANWYPPGFPRDNANLVVLPAEPAHESPHHAIDVAALLAADRDRGYALTGEVAQADLTSIGGLVGRRCAFDVRRPSGDLLHRAFASFAEGAYTYVIRLESLAPAGPARADHDAVFLAVARSAMPVPVAGKRRLGAPPTHTAQALAHWID